MYLFIIYYYFLFWGGGGQISKEDYRNTSIQLTIPLHSAATVPALLECLAVNSSVGDFLYLRMKFTSCWSIKRQYIFVESSLYVCALLQMLSASKRNEISNMEYI